MVEVAEGAERGGDDVVAGAALHVDDEGHAAGVVLELRVVDTARGRDAPKGTGWNGIGGVSERLAFVISHPQCTGMTIWADDLCRGTTLARLRPDQRSGGPPPLLVWIIAMGDWSQGSERVSRPGGERRHHRAQEHVGERARLGPGLDEHDRLVGEGRERGVRLPQNPVPRIALGVAGNGWYSARPVTAPRTNEPVRFTTNVPSGKRGRVRALTARSTRYRAGAPIACDRDAEDHHDGRFRSVTSPALATDRAPEREADERGGEADHDARDGVGHRDRDIAIFHQRRGRPRALRTS